MVEAIFPPRPLCKRDECFVRQCIDVIFALLRLYGFSEEGCKRKATYDHWIYGAAACANPVKYVKWRIAAYYSAHKGQDLPEAPSAAPENPSILAGGEAYRFLSILKNSDSESFETFITGVLYSKKGMPRPDKSFVKAAERDAFVKLTKPVPARPPQFMKNWSDMDEKPRTATVESVLSIATMEIQLYRTVVEIFAGSEFTDQDRVKPFFPSTSSTNINTRALGGTVGLIVSDPALLQGLKTEEDLIRTEWVRTKRSVAFSCDVSKLEQSFVTLYHRIVERAVEEIPRAIPQGLPEALKVRVISKGPPFLYTALKPIQKKMWSVLSQHPCFHLTGHPVDEWYVQQRMGKKLGDDESYLSVDYSDATNEMMSFVSNRIVDAICEIWKLTPVEATLFKRALTGHIIDDKRRAAAQTMGQLMGSIVSFPILCIANAAICRWAKELSTDRLWTLRDCPLAVNGDDGLIRGNETCRRLWAQIGSFCGLSPSVGKVYFSKTFLNINSTTYLYDANGWFDHAIEPGVPAVVKTQYFKHVPYVNLGLLFALKRSGGKVTTRTNGGEEEKGKPQSFDDWSYGARCQALVRDSPADLRERVLAQFIHINHDTLIEARIPWFIPESLGGLGLPRVGRFQPADKDLRLARKIYEHPTVFRLPAKPVNAPWRTWQYATGRVEFPRHAFVTTEGFGTGCGMASLPGMRGPFAHTVSMMTETQVLGMYCVEALFRVDGISTLYEINENNIQAAKNYVYHRQRLWKRALLSSIPLPQPFNPDRFPKAARTDNVPYIFGVSQHLSLEPVR